MPLNSVKIFGDLEKEVMEIVWETGRVSVRDVLKRLEKKRKIAYTTVMTVMARLHEKGILKRQMDKSGAFAYTPAKDRQSFLEKASQRIIKSFLKEYGEVAVAQFIDVIESEDGKLSKEWKEKLKELVK